MTVPCCHLCLKPLKLGERVVISKALAAIFHEDCNRYNPAIIDDRGEFEEVVRRNPIYSEFIPNK